MRTNQLRVLLWVSLFLAVPASALPQDTGTISGTVVDSSDQVLPGATVTLIDERTGAVRTVMTSARGDFLFSAVQPGTYAVGIELAGFRKYERRSNVLNASSDVALGRVKLELGTLTETVSVIAQGTVVETKNSDYSGLLTSTQIANIQTKGAEPHAVHRHQPRRAVQRGRRADQPELRHRDRDRQPDPAAARRPAVGAVQFLN